MGIPWETFWELNPKYLEIYGNSFQKRRAQEIEFERQKSWSIGYQVYVAIGTALSNKPYPKYQVTTQSENHQEDNTEAKKMAAGFAAWCANNKAFKNLPKNS